MRNAAYLVLFLLVGGCTSQTQPAKVFAPLPGQVQTLEGPGGSVRIGDRLSRAENAFPLPAGVKMTIGSLIYAFDGDQGYAYALPKHWFEATAKDGKIVALSASYSDSTKGNETLSVTLVRLGAPVRKIETRTSTTWIWDGGSCLRVFTMSKPISPGGKRQHVGANYSTIIGTKKGFKAMGLELKD